MKQSKINILIVDDNKDFCSILNEFLLMQNDMVVIGIARNGVNALDLIKEKKPDLILLDIAMPILDGVEVLKDLNKMDLDPKPHVIVLSAVDEDHITQRSLSLGADWFVIKPFDMETFIKKVRQTFIKTMCSKN